MIDAQLALQGAIVTAVKADAGMTALIGGRIYDKVPTNGEGVVTWPGAYVSFGPMQSLDASDQCHDGVTVAVQLDGWSRAIGGPEARRIGARLVALLDAPLTVPGFEVIVHEVEGLLVQREPDGLTTRAIARLLYTLAPSA